MNATAAEPAVVEPSAHWPPETGSTVVVLAQAGTVVERRLIAAWTRTVQQSGCTVILTEDAPAAVAQADKDDALIVPVRVIWMPAGNPDAPERVASTLLKRGPWRTLGQARMLSRRPGSSRLLVGEPACHGELLARFNERGSATGSDFPAFVERQADITLERSERQVRGDRFRAPRAVVEEVLTSKDFGSRAQALAQRLGRTPEGVLADCRVYLEEMASEERRLAIDIWAKLAKALHSRAYNLQVDTSQMQRLRELSQTHPLVFLPAHRSNLDPYVMTSVTYDNGLPHNHILGGINMAFWPLGPLGRRVGAVFIRRTFRDNEVYRFVLARYLGFLVAKRFNLEWYMEGGRSRTGKLLPPKLGLLNYLADAVEEMDLRDVLCIPTSINYDLLAEVGDMTSESRGGGKQAEGLNWMIKYARQQSDKLGAVHVRFGEPLNLYDALKAQSQAVSSDDAGARKVGRSKVAFEIFSRINHATVATAPALVSFALLGVGDRAMTLPQVRAVLEPILSYTRQRGTPTDERTRSLTTRTGVESTLRELVAHGVVERYSGGTEPVYRIGPQQELIAAFYRNSTIHWFVGRAIMELAVLRIESAGPDEQPLEVAWEEALRLRDVLKFEFFFSEKAAYRDELSAELELIDPDWRRDGGLDEVGRAMRESGALVAHRVLQPFVEAYSVVADRLEVLGEREADPDTVITECLGLGHQYLLQRRITNAEAVSTHLFRNAMKLAANRDLVNARPGVQARREEFARELHDMRRRLEELNRFDRKHGPLARTAGLNSPDTAATGADA